MKGIVVLILISTLNSTTAFYTRQSPDGSPNTQETITQEESIQALPRYIWENKLKHTGSEKLALDDFFKNAHQHVISWRGKLSQLKNDVVELQKKLGKCLYTVQSFYSNTNGVEMNGAVPYKDFDTGILKLLGSKTFDELFNIKNILRKDLSLAFVIDVSGSMKEDIAAVREQIIQPVTATIVTLNKAFVERNGYEMIKRIKNITVAGGYDCPEFAMDGILKSIKLSRNGSTLFVFTEADAKDANRQQEVADAAKTKCIMITPFITGNCSRERRSIQCKLVKDA
ncbi:unnamed protein product [Mytilus coruscus]|uniref:Hemicentin-1-like von Willebrand factor A domain-containing protein n=1 Tax=Mytilus coruscus TaxID=42192 RepID=A0A6J8BAF3_MYTCO|nr:unnamed protein product [Mytilus coruscus]